MGLLLMLGPLLVLLVGITVLVAPILALVAVTRLGSRVRELDARLLLLEQTLLAPRAAPAPTPPASAPAAPAPPVRPPTAPASPPRPVAPPPVAPPPPPETRVPAEPAPVPAARGSGWSQLEGLLGGMWLNRAGVLVLVVGIGFFLKYAFDNEWIGPSGRVALGLLAGVALLVLGERLQRAAYRVPAQGLIAAGIATLYLSVYAAYGFYQLVAQPVAFLFMVLVTATGLAVALHHEARAVAVLSNLGGFLTPVILNTGQDAAVALFTYLAVLDAGMVVSGYWRRWWELGLLSFAFTQMLYWGWYDTWYTSERLPIALGAATVFFFLFALVAPVQLAGGRLDRRLGTLWQGTAFLVFGAPLAYFLAARAILYPESATGLGLLCLVLATWHLMIGQWVSRYAPDHASLRLCYLAIALAFLTVAFPVQWSRHALVIAWSVEAATLIWGAFRLEAPRLRLAGCAVLALAGARWLTMLLDAPRHTGTFAVDNPAFLSTLAFALACALGAAIYGRADGRREGWEAAPPPLLTLAALGSLALFLTVELGVYRSWRLPIPSVDALRTLVWTATAVPLLALACRDRTRILLGAATTILLLVGALSLDVSRWEAVPPSLRPAVVNLRFAVGLVIVAAYGLYARTARAFPVSEHSRARLARMGAAAAGLFLLWNLSAEVALLPLDGWPAREAANVRKMGVSILWTLYAFAVMGLGIRRDRAYLRIGAIGLFGLTVAKVFLVDLGDLQAAYRILSFLILGAVLLLASFLYTRYRARWTAGGSS